MDQLKIKSHIIALFGLSLLFGCASAPTGPIEGPKSKITILAPQGGSVVYQYVDCGLLPTNCPKHSIPINLAEVDIPAGGRIAILEANQPIDGKALDGYRRCLHTRIFKAIPNHKYRFTYNALKPEIFSSFHRCQSEFLDITDPANPSVVKEVDCGFLGFCKDKGQ